ncbi:MAG TPA: metal-dependent hydrolase [Thermoplasmata archaeon]|nr:metal-dependent hydrolase [Thermoplasmata archaeon]
MDPFSHFLLGYLLGFGIWGPNGLQYVVAAAFAGGLPDADILLFPLGRRFPLLRHRGISHSILGITVIAAAGTFLVPRLFGWVFGAAFAAGSYPQYFVALELGGLSHVLLDAMDHWSVPIFAPFRRREYSLDADRIANLGGMVFTVVAYGAMLSERGRAPLWVWTITAWILLLAVLLYFAIRLGTRWWVERVRKAGNYSSVIPQANPFRFLLYAEEPSAPGRLRLRFVAHDLLRSETSVVRTVEAATIPTAPGPVGSIDEAVAVTYLPALKKSWILEETNRFARARRVDGGFEVFWYSLEMGFWGRSAGVVARIRSDGSGLSLASHWWNPAKKGFPG